MYRVKSQWDSLKTCVVGRAFPPDIFNFIKNIDLRKKFEKLALETEEDLQGLENFLKSKGVNVIRPSLSSDTEKYRIGQGFMSPPISPRDFMCMIDNKLYFPGLPNMNHAWMDFCDKKNLSNIENFNKLDDSQKVKFGKEWTDHKKYDAEIWYKKLNFFKDIFLHVLEQGTEVVASPIDYFNSSFITRLENKLVIGTQTYHDDKDSIEKLWSEMFPAKKTFVKHTIGHSDGCYTPVTDNLIISAFPDIDYSDIFPKAETVVVPPEVTLFDDKFAKALHMSEDKWFMPDMEQDKALIEMVEYYFSSWVGSVSESSFMVNILMLDPKNAVCSTDNKQVREAMKRHGVELHIVPFRHRFFWDTGIHCLTQDLDRV